MEAGFHGRARKMRLGNIIEITDHLILPFGIAKKFDLQKITLAAVAANEIYLRADIPCVYINVAEKKPLRLLDFFTVFGRGRRRGARASARQAFSTGEG
jgi:hypothetical protein